MARAITYKCSQCGSSVIITRDSSARMTPIYCCGTEVAEVSASKKKPSKSKLKKKPVKKTKKKTRRK